MNIGFVGLGNMGTALAQMVAANGHNVLGWEYDAAVVKEINASQQNSRFLPGVPLNKSLRATADINEACKAAEILFTALPARFTRAVLEPARNILPASTVIVNLSKGFERDTFLTSSQVLAQLFPRHSRIMLSGPSIANEFVHDTPTMVVVAGQKRQDLLMVARLLDSGCFRTRVSDDETGVELGGILKNIYAIGLGIFDGLSITTINFRAVYLTLALEEMTRLGEKLGAQKETFFFISGLGDLLATSMSTHSHNRRLGELLAKKHSISDIEKTMGVLPEGYTTLQAVLYLSEKNHVAMPLVKALWDVINGKLHAQKFAYSCIRDFIEE